MNHIKKQAEETHARNQLAKTETIEDPATPSYVKMKTMYNQRHIHHLTTQQLDIDTTFSQYMSIVSCRVVL